jgi:hypothetical protein
MRTIDAEGALRGDGSGLLVDGCCLQTQDFLAGSARTTVPVVAGLEVRGVDDAVRTRLRERAGQAVQRPLSASGPEKTGQRKDGTTRRACGCEICDGGALRNGCLMLHRVWPIPPAPRH